MKPIAQTISYLLHPLLIPFYGLFFIFNSDSVFSFTPKIVQIYSYGVTCCTLFLLPLISLPLLKKCKLISNYNIDLPQERVYLALITIFSAFLGFYLIGKIDGTNIVQQLYLIQVIILAGFSIITLRWKMSIHMTAVGAICGFLLILGLKYDGYVQNWFILMLMISGLLATCRLYLKKHNPAQIYAGFLFGICFVLLILYY